MADLYVWRIGMEDFYATVQYGTHYVGNTNSLWMKLSVHSYVPYSGNIHTRAVLVWILYV